MLQNAYLQKSVPRPPKTNNILPKFCQKLANFCQKLAMDRAERRGLVGELLLPLPRGRHRHGASVQLSVRGQGQQNWENQQNFANFWRARSRLYQNEILQENMRLTAFFKLYKICILLHRCNLKIFAKNRFEKSAIFVKIQQKICKCRKICKILPNFKNFSQIIWQILKNTAKRVFSCKDRRRYSRKFAENLPKICQTLATTLRVHGRSRTARSRHTPP